MAAFDPDEVLALAQHLMTRRDEASHRGAVSRAYYGVFLLARELAGIRIKRAAVHRLTQEHYRRIGEEEIAEKLEVLRDVRNAADYDVEHPLSRHAAERALQCSRQLRSLLKLTAGRAKYWGTKDGAPGGR